MRVFFIFSFFINLCVTITTTGLIKNVVCINYSYKTISPNPNTNLYYIKGWCLLLSDYKFLLDLLPNNVYMANLSVLLAGYLSLLLPL